jgi:signal transduction histidine kinase/CheY-like chemotaxis protein
VNGLLVLTSEVTDFVLSERRQQTVRDIASLMGAETEEDATRQTAQVIERNPHDIPFAVLYLFDSSKTRLTLRENIGIAAGTRLTPPEFSVVSGIGPLARVAASGKHEVLEIGPQLDSISSRGWRVPPREVAVSPLRSSTSGEQIGVLVAGINPHSPLDADYRQFLESLGRQVSYVILRIREAARQRHLFAEIKRHTSPWDGLADYVEEFRTPLAVALGRLDQELAQEEHHSAHNVRIARNNVLRLLSRMDSMVDLVRIQAGGMDAIFEPCDLGSDTSRMVHAFASAVKQNGLQFAVDCPPLGEDAFVDRCIWDRLMLTLLSEAVRRTEAGEIGISMRKVGAWIDTVIWDTGTAIPKAALSPGDEVFPRGRAGVRQLGPSLGQRFAALHGGHITMKSEMGKGSKFVISIPRGRAHLPSDRIDHSGARTSTAYLHAYVEDALRWAPETVVAKTDMNPDVANAGANWRRSALVGGGARRVLLAESDPDLRRYLLSVGRDLYAIESVYDGESVLRSLRHTPFDLLLVDLDLAGVGPSVDGLSVDGLSVVRAVRAETELADLPIVVISSRSLEEDRLRAFASGANDYLLKPFSAPELMVRLESQIALSEARWRMATTKSPRNGEQLTFLSSALDQNPVGIVIVDLASRELVVKNRKIYELFGSFASEVRRVDDLPDPFGSRPDGTPVYRRDCPLVRAVEYGDTVLNDVMVYRLPDGREFTALVSARRFHDDQQRPRGAIVSYAPAAGLSHCRAERSSRSGERRQPSSAAMPHHTGS